MMDVSIHLLQDSDAAALFEFECENREYFEETVPGRGDDYYMFEEFLKRNQALLQEQRNGLSEFYLIKGVAGEILGRINLIDIDPDRRTGEVGFRIGAAHAGKGIGNRALGLLLKARSDMKQIRGKTTTANIASQRVLEKNGFRQVGVGEEVFELNGEKVKFVYYVSE